MGDLNAGLVPTYLIKSARDTLRLLSDVPRADLRGVAAEAKKVVRSLGQPEENQSMPRGEVIIAKVELPKVPGRTFRGQPRQEAFKVLFAEKILKAFQSQDAESSGRGRFHLILTHTEA